MERIARPAFAAVAVPVAAAGFTAHSADTKPAPQSSPSTATLRVTFTTEAPVTFEASYEGDAVADGGGFIESRQTPFEMEVAAQDFRDVFHKT